MKFMRRGYKRAREPKDAVTNITKDEVAIGGFTIADIGQSIMNAPRMPSVDVPAVLHMAPAPAPSALFPPMTTTTAVPEADSADSDAQPERAAANEQLTSTAVPNKGIDAAAASDDHAKAAAAGLATAAPRASQLAWLERMLTFEAAAQDTVIEAPASPISPTAPRSTSPWRAMARAVSESAQELTITCVAPRKSRRESEFRIKKPHNSIVFPSEEAM